MSYELDKETFEACFPHASKKNIDLYFPYYKGSCAKYCINTPIRLAAFFAQIEVESGSLHYVEEIADGSAYEYRKDLGNLLPEALEIAHKAGTTTGRFYKGRGHIQLTGFYNYKKYGDSLGLDLEHKPELLKEPQYAVASACLYFNSHGCNELADVGLFGAITKKINGGYNGSKDRLAAYSRNKKVFGLT
jgi:predicted chitinase